MHLNSKNNRDCKDNPSDNKEENSDALPSSPPAPLAETIQKQKTREDENKQKQEEVWLTELENHPTPPSSDDEEEEPPPPSAPPTQGYKIGDEIRYKNKIWKVTSIKKLSRENWLFLERKDGNVQLKVSISSVQKDKERAKEADKAKEQTNVQANTLKVIKKTRQSIERQLTEITEQMQTIAINPNQPREQPTARYDNDYEQDYVDDDDNDAYRKYLQDEKKKKVL